MIVYANKAKAGTSRPVSLADGRGVDAHARRTAESSLYGGGRAAKTVAEHNMVVGATGIFGHAEVGREMMIVERRRHYGARAVEQQTRVLADFPIAFGKRHGAVPAVGYPSVVYFYGFGIYGLGPGYARGIRSFGHYGLFYEPCGLSRGGGIHSLRL